MSPTDWVQITVQTPLLAVPVLAVLLVALVVAGLVAYRRRTARIRTLVGEVETLRRQLAESAGDGAQGLSGGDAYRDFIYNISHEVSNPLQSIQTNLDNMASCSFDETGRWHQYHQIISGEVQRLGRLMENLRLLARLETPSAPTVREPVNLKGVVEDVIMTLFERAEEEGVRLAYVGPQRPARVLGDRDQLRQVLLNLVDNGIKYSQNQGGEVIISLLEEDDHLRVRVADDGVGIAEEDLAHIFDTAYRAPDARSFRRRGAGLGLALAKRIVEQHGGQVWVESRPGEGTTCSFDLPLHVPS